MKLKKLWLFVTLVVLILSSCDAHLNDDDQANHVEVPPSERLDFTSLDTLIDSMTLEEKVGQLFIIRPEALDFSIDIEKIESADTKGITKLNDELKKTLADYPVGGIIAFSKNLESPEQIIALNNELQSISPVPMFLAIDEEGGLVARLANHPNFDLPKYASVAEVGETADYNKAYQMGDTIGQYLKEFGFNMDLAPVADVNTNPLNPVIGERAFSSDPEIVKLMATGMADGLLNQTILPVFKHFPGHGDTKEDSHHGLAVVDKTLNELENCEWIPYKELNSQIGVMVGHIAVPNLTNDLVPASMSQVIVGDILKDQLGFNGLVLTDSLSMKAITETYSTYDAVVGALKAGCHILLMPQDFKGAFDSVIAAIDNGDLSVDILDETVRQILTFKNMYGLIQFE